MIGALMLCTLGVVGGVALAVLPAPDVSGARVDPPAARRVATRIVAAFVAAASIVVVSGWLAPGVAVGLGTFWAVGSWQRRQRANTAEIERLDALASWVESVRDVLLAGEQPVGAITATVAATPPTIRPHVRRLAAGLSRQDPDLVFRRFADDLDDPLADLVAAGLAIAIRRGARTVPVLTALAEQTRQQADRRLLIEAERAPTRREVQALTTIMGLLVLALLLFGRHEYLDAYDTPSGQGFLTVALIGYAALIVRVQRLARFPRPARFVGSSVVRRDGVPV